MAQSPEEVLSQLHEIADAYRDLTGAVVPATLKEAVKTRWEVGVDIAEMAGLLYYPKEQQEQDSRRAIPLTKAVRMLQDYEQRMIKAMVPTPSEIAGGLGVTAVKSAWFGVWGVLYTTGSAIIRFLYQIVLHPSQAATLAAELLPIFLSGFSKSLNLLAIPEFKRWIGTGLKQRKVIEDRMRLYVLVQKTGPRYRKRAKSRR